MRDSDGVGGREGGARASTHRHLRPYRNCCQKKKKKNGTPSGHVDYGFFFFSFTRVSPTLREPFLTHSYEKEREREKEYPGRHCEGKTCSLRPQSYYLFVFPLFFSFAVAHAPNRMLTWL